MSQRPRHLYLSFKQGTLQDNIELRFKTFLGGCCGGERFRIVFRKTIDQKMSQEKQTKNSNDRIAQKKEIYRLVLSDFLKTMLNNSFPCRQKNTLQTLL